MTIALFFIYDPVTSLLLSLMNSTKAPNPEVGVKRVWKAFFYSISGFKLAFRDEAAFRQELLLVVVLTPVCLLLPFDMITKALILFSHCLVLITELLNTAVETIVDKVSPEFSEEAKKAKDTGSAAVLLSLFASGGLWFFALIQLL